MSYKLIYDGDFCLGNNGLTLGSDQANTVYDYAIISDEICFILNGVERVIKRRKPFIIVGNEIYFPEYFEGNIDQYHIFMRDIEVLKFSLGKKYAPKYNFLSLSLVLTKSIRNLDATFYSTTEIVLAKKTVHVILSNEYVYPLNTGKNIMHLSFGGGYYGTTVLVKKIESFEVKHKVIQPIILSKNIVRLRLDSCNLHIDLPKNTMCLVLRQLHKTILGPRMMHLVIQDPKLPFGIEHIKSHLTVWSGTNCAIDNLPNGIKKITIYRHGELMMVNIPNKMKYSWIKHYEHELCEY